VTERRHRVRDLERQRARLEQFASTLSHDIRNPLNVVEGRLELAREDGDLSHLDRADVAVRRIDRIIDDLLALSREGRTISEREPVLLATAAHNAWETTRTEAATLTADLDEEAVVYADGTRLRYVLENLFRNAIQFGGPDVVIRIDAHEDGFLVEDDGPRIPRDERERVFEYEYTTDESGTGLGLASVDSIAGAHGWSVAVTDADSGVPASSSPGSTFAGRGTPSSQGTTPDRKCGPAIEPSGRRRGPWRRRTRDFSRFRPGIVIWPRPPSSRSVAACGTGATRARPSGLPWRSPRMRAPAPNSSTSASGTFRSSTRTTRTPATQQCWESASALGDTLLLGTPMYHGSYASPLKTALDYCGFDKFEKKTVGLLGVAGGSFPITALEHLRSVRRALDCWVIPHQAAVARAASQFADGELTDDRVRERVQTLGVEAVRFANIEADPPSFESGENVGALD
jgi:NAD(P)H-dependent FMN reductase/anti-sigma regulatory factor (Ser/Thr protein kinase)